MEQASSPTYLASSLEVSGAKQSTISTTNHANTETIGSILKLSPRHNSSSLFDSFKIQAVTQQLNKAIQGSNMSLSPYIRPRRLALYQQQQLQIYRENIKMPRRLSSSKFSTALDNKPSTRDASMETRSVVTWLWKKVRQGFLRNK